jgi:hypothetical protein
MVMARTKTGTKTRAKNRKQNLTRKFNGKANVSTMAIRAISEDGDEWHVDTDINGIRDHANLTNSEIMEIMSHPAHKVDLRTRLIRKLKGVDDFESDIMTSVSVPTPTPAPNIDQIGMFGEIDYPHVRIYRKNCGTRPVLMDNLSPLHEATIVPRNEIIHLAPLHSLHTMKMVKPAKPVKPAKSLKKRPIKGKKSRKNRK